MLALIASEPGVRAETINQGGLMDPATLAASIAALLTPYLKKAGEDFVGEVGKYVQDQAKTLWQKLRAKLDDDPPTRVVLDEFERDPDARADAFKKRIEETVAADKPLLDEIAADLAELKRQAPHVRVVQQMREAEDIVGVKVKRVKSGTVDVSQSVGTAKKITGVEIDEIG